MIPESKKLIANVSKENIVEKLMKQHKIELRPDQLTMDAPLERYGRFEIPVKIEDLQTTLKVQVQER